MNGACLMYCGPGSTMDAAAQAERRETVNYLETYHRFLKTMMKDLEEKHEKPEEPDRSRGVPAPPAEKPFPEDAALIDLTAPDQLAFGRMPVAQAIRQRRSRRQYSQEPLSLDELSFLLWATQGVQKSYRDGFGLRSVPAGPPRHPFETYLLVHRVTGLEPGLYRYLPLEHRLCLLFLDAGLAERSIDACGGNRMVRRSAVTFVWTTIPYRKHWWYGVSLDQHGAKGIAIEAGHVCQNLYLACEAIGAGTVAVGGYHQSKMDALLGIDGQEEFAVYVSPVGKVKSGGAVEWTGQIDGITREGDTTRMWLKSFSGWEGDIFVVELPLGEVPQYAGGDYVAVRGNVVDVCSSYDGWPLVRGTAIERREDPDVG